MAHDDPAPLESIRRGSATTLSLLAGCFVLAALVASLLAGAAGWALATLRFDVPFVFPWFPMILLTTGLVFLTTLVGLANSYEVLERPPLEVLRAE